MIIGVKIIYLFTENGLIGQMWEVGDWGSKIVGGGRLGVKMCGRWEIGGLKYMGDGRWVPPPLNWFSFFLIFLVFSFIIVVLLLLLGWSGCCQICHLY